MHIAQHARVLLAVSGLLIVAPSGRTEQAVDIVITGHVRTDSGAALYGANVTIDAAKRSVGTDEKGFFRIELPERYRGSTVVVRARMFGRIPVVRSMTLDRDSLVADFALKEDVNRLSQVVVTGVTGNSLYETKKLPFTVATVTAQDMPGHGYATLDPTAGESYARIRENGFRSPRIDPLSTFGVDVDRASYSNVRRIITEHQQRPPVDAVRIEELINYFPYDYEAPTGAHPFAVHTEVATAPWAPEHLLVRVGLQARTVTMENAPASNLVFLIDVSGSMSSPDKLPLLKEAFRMLVRQMREQDRVAIVVYAGSAGLVLPSTSGANKDRILAALDRLEAGGSTAGGQGITLAYDVARRHFLDDGNNRVILATDGDFNVGVTDNAELERMIETRRREGTFLTVLGFGGGNLQDDRMEMLADKGNGNYAYVDTPLEARKVFVHELGGTLVTVAKDVKLQVEFNPALVSEYRLIGYENRALAAKDFKDDAKDAGDIGAGHSVTALYEVIPVARRGSPRWEGVDSLRYQRTSSRRAVAGDDALANELMLVRLRYKAPDREVSVPLEVVVPNRVTNASREFQFAQAVAAFGMLLRDSEFKGQATPEMVNRLAEGAIGRDPWGYRAEFVELVRKYRALPEVRAARVMDHE